VIDSRSGQPAWRTWLIGIGVLAIGAYLYLFISAILSPELPPVVGGTSVVMRTLHVQGERGSKLGWTFSADSSETSVDGSVTTYHNVRDGTYFEQGKPAYHLTAADVMLDARSQNYSATGGVHIWAVIGIQPRDIKADAVTWNQPLQTLTCPGSVKVLYHGSRFNGSNVSVNFRDGSIRTGVSAVTYRKKK
jgi:hypothetical protein